MFKLFLAVIGIVGCAGPSPAGTQIGTNQLKDSCITQPKLHSGLCVDTAKNLRGGVPGDSEFVLAKVDTLDKLTAGTQVYHKKGDYYATDQKIYMPGSYGRNVEIGYYGEYGEVRGYNVRAGARMVSPAFSYMVGLGDGGMYISDGVVTISSHKATVDKKVNFDIGNINIASCDTTGTDHFSLDILRLRPYNGVPASPIAGMIVRDTTGGDTVKIYLNSAWVNWIY